MMFIPRWFAILVIHIYRLFGSPYMRYRGVRCLRIPTCSEYAILALRKYPLVQAIKMIYQRVKDCNVGNSRSFIDYP
jgi:putative component of membrane protein insertase Oxa1/YidC/SpoIIIJ protein YidD